MSSFQRRLLPLKRRSTYRRLHGVVVQKIIFLSPNLLVATWSAWTRNLLFHLVCSLFSKSGYTDLWSSLNLVQCNQCSKRNFRSAGILIRRGTIMYRQKNRKKINLYSIYWKGPVWYSRKEIMFRIVFWGVLPCKMIVDRRFRGAYCLHHQEIETSVYNHFTRQYIPEDNSEHHTRRRENLKSHKKKNVPVWYTGIYRTISSTGYNKSKVQRCQQLFSAEFCLVLTSFRELCCFLR
jgi:hypothetical protein